MMGNYKYIIILYLSVIIKVKGIAMGELTLAATILSPRLLFTLDNVTVITSS